MSEAIDASVLAARSDDLGLAEILALSALGFAGVMYLIRRFLA